MIKKKEVTSLIRSYFKPEFINRIDEIIFFNPLNNKIQEQIVNKLLGELKLKLLENDYLISFDKTITKYVLEMAYSETYGARPLKRFIQKEIETFIASKIIANEIKNNQEYNLTYNKKLVLSSK